MLDVESFVAGSFVVTASQNLRMCDSHNARAVGCLDTVLSPRRAR